MLLLLFIVQTLYYKSHNQFSTHCHIFTQNFRKKFPNYHTKLPVFHRKPFITTHFQKKSPNYCRVFQIPYFHKHFHKAVSKSPETITFPQFPHNSLPSTVTTLGPAHDPHTSPFGHAATGLVQVTLHSLLQSDGGGAGHVVSVTS